MEEIYVCKKCNKAYQKRGWLIRHLKEKGHGLLIKTYTEKAKNIEINQIKHDIFEIKELLMNMKDNTNWNVSKPKPVFITGTIKASFSAVISEMKASIKIGEKLTIEKFEDFELGVKSDEEIEKILMKTNQIGVI